MDLAIYISELLSQNGKVNVPGLGRFSKTRKNGYYDEQAHKFFPPHYHIDFDPNPDTDNDLIDYVAKIRKISPESAEYFIEKYATDVKERVANEEINIDGLGTLSNEQLGLTFKPAPVNGDQGAIFYGLPTINAAPIGNETVAPPPVEDYILEDELIHEDVISEDDEDYIAPETEGSKTNIWLTILIAVTVLAVIGMGLYIYKPSWFNQNAVPAKTVVPVRAPAVKQTPATDTVKKDSVQKDTAKQTAAKDTAGKNASAQPPAAIAPVTTGQPTAADNIKGPHYEILGGAFNTDEEANQAIKVYERLGFKAHILTNVRGKLRKVTLGSFATRKEANDEYYKILATRKVKSIFIQKYPR